MWWGAYPQVGAGTLGPSVAGAQNAAPNLKPVHTPQAITEEARVADGTRCMRHVTIRRRL